jgi:cell division protein FtsN
MTAERAPTRLFGFLAGLVTGLAIAVFIALYLTKSPVPFVNKVQHSTENVTPEPGDPNRSLFSPLIPGPQAPAGAPAAATGASGAAEAPHASAPPAPAAAAPGDRKDAEAADDTSGARLMLQVGAYRSAEDADAARAQLALLGLDAKVTPVQADGATLYRVRLGPYGALDDLNGIRRTLSDNGIQLQVVHVR